ncbi:hypothetical protein B0H17DRAFT_289558 [Mycena rosella]|uniref:C2 domain-containing protein n=1 Tax=Mycena rosella TaxID=1033263 RepID=A0AAD7CVB1_MYCRO|nr:hypothetical protein B0H17DRAFT_289558 [Mycena rosella]
MRACRTSALPAQLPAQLLRPCRQATRSWVRGSHCFRPIHSSSLPVQTVSGISWRPGPTHGKTPNLYVAIYLDGLEFQRTHTVKRELAPRWDYLSKLSNRTSKISLRLFHDSSLPFARDKCLGTVDTDIAGLVELCASDGDVQVGPLS